MCFAIVAPAMEDEECLRGRVLIPLALRRELGDGHAEPYIVRFSRKAIEIGLPCCPCGQEMVLEETGRNGGG